MSSSGQNRCRSEGNCTFAICAIVAFLNHGNKENGIKSSSPQRSSQTPWGETLATSTSELCFPAVATFIGVCFYEGLGFHYLLLA